MTLIEAIIALTVLALAIGVMVPSMMQVGRADLRRATRMLALQLRHVANDAALGGQTYRVSLAVGSGKVQVEATEEALRMDPRSGEAVGSSALIAEFAVEGLQAAADKANENVLGQLGGSALGQLMRIGQSGQAAASHPFVAKGTIELGKGVRVLDVWTEGRDVATTEGTVHLYFFPAGYTQEALVHLGDGDGNVFSLKLSALTCRSETFAHYVDVPR